MILWPRLTTILGTVLKGHGIRKVVLVGWGVCKASGVEDRQWRAEIAVIHIRWKCSSWIWITFRSALEKIKDTWRILIKRVMWWFLVEVRGQCPWPLFQLLEWTLWLPLVLKPLDRQSTQRYWHFFFLLFWLTLFIGSVFNFIHLLMSLLSCLWFVSFSKTHNFLSPSTPFPLLCVS